ncbi:DUF2628 domain-containing protein [Paenibacillus macerans]|uniref:DUF2628 domain-containing protein n=1 Tax=Paenibacillus macerans TaxID=44252 RepID=UPI001BCB94E6|nr:DUF2628 domain-containing protein [Paenibacillus macerans]
MEARYCSSCGQRTSTTARFCENCGKPLEHQAYRQKANQQQINQQQTHQGRTYQLQAPTWKNHQSNSNDVPELEWLRLYTHGDKYIEKWRKDSKWNWPSFLFSPVWFGYRKMYAECAIYIGITVVLGLFELLLGFSLRYALTIIFILNGIFGNKLYYRKAKKEIDHILLLHANPEIRRNLIQQKGGTSGWGIAFGIIMLLIGAIILGYLEELTY